MKQKKIRKNIDIARKHCANWNSGVCLGVNMYRTEGQLHQVIVESMIGKKCFADVGCDYFKNIVIQGIKNEN